MNLAKIILENRPRRHPMLTVKLAKKANRVIRQLPTETTVYDLYYKRNPIWIEFLSTCNRWQRSAVTKALGSLNTGLTIGQIAACSVEQLIGWKSGKVTAAFLNIAFNLH